MTVGDQRTLVAECSLVVDGTAGDGHRTASKEIHRLTLRDRDGLGDLETVVDPRFPCGVVRKIILQLIERRNGGDPVRDCGGFDGEIAGRVCLALVLVVTIVIGNGILAL